MHNAAGDLISLWHKCVIMNAATKTSIGIPFNNEIFGWARARCALNIDTVAKKVRVKAERIADWEDGICKPTIKQARKLADLYERPFLEFFLDQIPDISETQLVADFRLYRDAPVPEESVALKKVQTWAEEQRLNALDLFQLIGETPPKFPVTLHADTNNDVEDVSTLVREHFNFSVNQQFEIKLANSATLPNILRANFEKYGVIVLKNSDIGRLRTRGLCLFSEPLPIIIFGSESPSAQAFTLSHEFAHILLKISAISNPTTSSFENDSQAEKERVEGWCNRFAAAFLIPKKNLAEDFAIPSDLPATSIEDCELERLSRKYAVSPHAILIRLVNLGYVDSSYYWRHKRPIFIQQEDSYKNFGISPYYGSRYRTSKGNLYTGLVLEAWSSGRITNHNAAEFMGIKKITHLNDIRDHFER